MNMLSVYNPFLSDFEKVNPSFHNWVDEMSFPLAGNPSCLHWSICGKIPDDPE
jgi:hypothetical protein